MTTIYEAGSHVLIHAEYANPVRHSHRAAHFIISMGEEMHVTAGQGEYRCRGVMIPSGMAHVVDTHGSAALVFLYDAVTDAARRVGNVQVISDELCAEIAGRYAAYEQAPSLTAYRHLEQCVLAQLGLSEAANSVTDERIKAVMEHIRAGCAEGMSCREAAETVHLSQGRFSHLFRQQTGMTFAAYVIYQRLMHAYAQLIRGKSITEAALEAGFASSAHFADTNRRVFGLPASSITRECAFVWIR